MAADKSFSKDQILKKVLHYCTYQERAHSEVRTKLLSLGARGDLLEETLSYLIVEGFLNEERFAKAFAGGKFRMKQWGRLKIVRALEMKGVSTNCIRSGLKEISDDDYQATLTKLLTRKSEELDPNANALHRRSEIANYAIRKGFEPELVWELTRNLIL